MSQILATIDSKGNRVSVHSFTNRRRIEEVLSPSDYKDFQKKLKLLDSSEVRNLENFPNIDNGEIHDWVMVGGRQKYGRTMYCLKTGIFRWTTMGEFYENSIVD